MADGYMQVDLPKFCRVCEQHSEDGLACLAADHHVIRETEWFDKRPEWCPIIPATDVRPVVRCKNCIHHYYAVDCAGMCRLGIGNSLLDDDFCSRGADMRAEE